MALTFEASSDSSSTTDFNEYAVVRATYRIQQLAFKGGKHFEQMQEDFMTEKVGQRGHNVRRRVEEVRDVWKYGGQDEGSR